MKYPVTYTAQDIERYYGGQLSPAEMHALEKAALDDPFLADALEGYLFTKTATDDLASLQQKLKQKIEGTEKRGVFFMSHPWMKMAALFLLIAGGGWLVVQTLSDSNKQEVAATTPVNKQQVPVIPPADKDSISTFSDAPATNETVALNKNASSSPQKKIYKTTDKNLSPNNTYRIPSSQLNRDSSVATVTALPQMADDKFTKELDSMKDVAVTRSDENLAGRKKTNDTLKNFDVVLKKSDAELSEVVVINPKNKSKSPQARQMQMKVDTLEPANGWGYFDDYVATNIKSPDELKIKPVSGDVELSFELNKEGEPVNITVTKSLCNKCDEEAIRLLKEGPKWKNKAKKGKVNIRF